MATYTRNNAWNNGGTFDNLDLLWYAKAVGVMMSRSLDQPGSWWFFGAIHGEYVDVAGFPGWGSIPGTPIVPTSPTPSPSSRARFWRQCQHQSWYFPPWHRGYLFALEAHLREAIRTLEGPHETWALPYWNYLGPDNQYEIPPALTAATLPDGTANPLFVTARYGPNSDGNIYIQIPPVSDDCQANTIYTGSNAATPRPGYGGPVTGFNHGRGRNGNLENNPHNQVHVDIGGMAPNQQSWGLMSDPGLAALDPVFYLHHCNIDRLWAEWVDNGNSNPTDPNWLNGPAAIGEREFVMPMPDDTDWTFTPANVDSTTLLDYTYDSIVTPVPPTPAPDPLAIRLRNLGADAPRAAMSSRDNRSDTSTDSELLGANEGSLRVTGTGCRATVRLDTAVRQRMSASLAAASSESLPDRAYLQLENVRGVQDAHKLNVYVNGQAAGTVALFGLRTASLDDEHHAGSGLTFELDISAIIDKLHLESGLETDSLDVRIVPNGPVSDAAEISIGRISVHREGHR